MGMNDDIFDVIEPALERAGYRILDGDSDSVIIRCPNSDLDYEIYLREIFPDEDEEEA